MMDMNIAEILEALAEDPYNGELRSKLAFEYFILGDHKKVLKQYQLICAERELDDNEIATQVKSLKALGFVEEAQSLEIKLLNRQSHLEKGEIPSISKVHIIESSDAEVENRPALSLAYTNKKHKANIVPLVSPDKNLVRFTDIGGNEDTKKTLRLQIIEPFLKPELYNKFKKQAGGGVLLYGAPGCGKTMLAKAIAYECKAEFIPVRISEVLSRWIGESESNLSSFFEKARANKPSLLFFDELDALAYARNKSYSDYSRTLVNEFLNQLDGVGFDNEDILFLAATNMPWDVDSAMKRPGRFSKLIFVPPPCISARAEILSKLLIGVPHEAIDFDAIAKRLHHFSGADIVGLVDLAKETALREMIDTGIERPLCQADFDSVLVRMIPSTEDWLRTAKNLVKYSGGDRSYQDVEEYLRDHRLL
jgi:SpoVK/Ycf46/Vps4 family AAA+-type ATPase